MISKGEKIRDLETKRLIIRKFRIEDAHKAYYNWANDETFVEYFDFRAHRSVEETRRLIESAIIESEMGEPVWVLEEKQSKEIVRFIKTANISTANRMCNIEFGIGYKWHKNEYLFEGLKKVLNYLFYEEKFELICTYLYNSEDNITKIKHKLLTKIGMKKEAVLRKRRVNIKTKKLEDKIIYSITQNELKTNLGSEVA